MIYPKFTFRALATVKKVSILRRNNLLRDLKYNACVYSQADNTGTFTKFV